MTQIDLIGQCFYALNTFKRHRALEKVKRMEGNHDEGNYHELKQYQFIDNLELALRAIQRDMHTHMPKQNKEEEKDGDSGEEKS